MSTLAHLRRILIGFGLLTIIFSTVIGFAAANSVADSGADRSISTIDPNDLAPPECSHLNLTNLVTTPSSTYQWFGSTVYVYRGTNGNDLMIGTGAYDDFIANNGHDCIIGGDGIDYLFSGRGNDVMNGGPGNDSCFGQGGNNTFINCQSQSRSPAIDPEQNDQIEKAQHRLEN
ncbi:MAG TPA: hypothetical protein ENJ56_06735 [Anaerolineae bacterium]|nr:hypothetical protein [Anaerolineae bacterium]